MANESKTKKKTLSYRRAGYFSTSPEMKNLEDYLAIAHQKFSTIKQRTVHIKGYPVIECRSYKHEIGTGMFLHLASYNPGEPASIVPHAGDTTSSDDVGTMAPPKNSEFMDGDMMVMVAGNNVLLCATSVHEKTAERYMRQLLDAAQIDKVCRDFSLEKVGDMDKLKLIKSHGVKKVILNASAYDASLDYLERTTLSSKLGGALMSELKALVLKEHNKTDIDLAETLTAKIVLSFDTRRKKADFGRETLNSMASKIIDEDDDGFTIETLTGEKIRHNEIAVRKSVLLPRHGKSVWRDDAWFSLKEYFSELKISGALEQ